MYESLLLESGKVVSGVGAIIFDDEQVIAIPVLEGNAVIVSISMPSLFTPGVKFVITTTVRNTGGDDDLIIRITNTDTNVVIAETILFVSGGKTAKLDDDITLVQTTDFNGLVQVGHIE